MMNYYHVLGINEEATQQEIKDAYRNMINAFHPDHYRGPNKEFAVKKTQEINEAYETLKDPQLRLEYDESLKFGKEYQNEGSAASRSTKKEVNYDRLYSEVFNVCEQFAIDTFSSKKYRYTIGEPILYTTYKRLSQIISGKLGIEDRSSEWLCSYMKKEGINEEEVMSFMEQYEHIYEVDMWTAIATDFGRYEEASDDLIVLAFALSALNFGGFDSNDFMNFTRKENMLDLLSRGFNRYNELERLAEKIFDFFKMEFGRSDWEKYIEFEQKSTNTEAHKNNNDRPNVEKKPQKNKASFGVWVIIGIIALVIGAYSSGVFNNDSSQSQQFDSDSSGPPIIGTWYFLKSEAFDKDNNPVYNDLAESDFESTIDLNDDGSIVIHMFETSYYGTWELGDHGKILVSDIEPDEDKIQPVVQTLSLYTDNGSYYLMWGFDYDDVFYVFTYN